MITTTEIEALVRHWQPLLHLLAKGPIADYRPPGYVHSGRDPFFYPRGDSLRSKEVLNLQLTLPRAGKYEQVLLLTTDGRLVVCAHHPEHGLYFHLVDGKDLGLYAPESNTLCAELAHELRRLRKTAARDLKLDFEELLLPI